MLSNLETEKSKLLQIVLVGQPNLREKLNAPELEQLRQRITVSYHLMPLDAQETANYINHRLRRAAIGAPVEFPRDATDAIHGRSRGVPRIVNVICDAALVFGYAEERRAVDLPLVEEVLSELEVTGVLPPVGATNMTESAPSTVPASARTPRPAVAVDSQAARLPHLAPSAPAPRPVVQPSVASAAPRVETSGPDPAIRSAQLDQREEALRQRERELAEQRRILAEEYRLLRTKAASSAPAHAGIGSSPQAIRVQVQQPMRMTTERHESWWQRTKKMLGVRSPAVE